ncbi:MAG: J domain-containing protein [Solirubrobacterales bacterium]|nr:J domain-containing protein [Solirubrobacterales bacterium]MBV9536302.1 J domain-containing protein [Solirubrobacterales bacterium]
MGKARDVEPPNASESPYAVLGLHPSADAQAIRRTYRRIMRELHPDVCDDPQASDVTARVTAAYEILGNPDRRREFDSHPANILKGWSDKSLWGSRWCAHCGRDVQRAADGGRSPTARNKRPDACYCGDACRQAAYRARRNSTEQFRPARTDPKQGSAAVGTEVRTGSVLKGLIRVEVSISRRRRD